LERMLKAGNDVLIVSKPKYECIYFLCKAFMPYQKQIMFRFTIGSADNEVLSLWEPNAPTFNERLQSLKVAFESGYETSISCEPMLDLHIDKVVDAVRDYVTDAVWLGKANNLIKRMKTNGCDEKMMLKGSELISWQCDTNIWDLYNKYKDDPKIKWKESIKEVVGLDLPTEKGTDK
jgi:DNA repair photolyase